MFPLDTDKIVYTTAKAFIFKKVDAKNNEKNIGRIKLTTDAETFAQLLGGEAYKQFMDSKEFRTAAELTAYLSNKDNLAEKLFLAELDIRYMVAFGFGFLDNDTKGNEMYILFSHKSG